MYFDQVLGCVISTHSLTEEMSFMLILFCVDLCICFLAGEKTGCQICCSMDEQMLQPCICMAS